MITNTWNECRTALESALMSWDQQSTSWFSKKTWSDWVSKTDKNKILIKGCPLEAAIKEDKAYREAGFFRRLLQRSKFAGARSRVEILPYAVQHQNLLNLNQEMQALQEKFTLWQLANETQPLGQNTITQAKAIQADITTVLKKLQDWVNALPIKHRTPLVQTGEPLPAIAKCLNNLKGAMENTEPLLAPKNRLTEYQSLQNLPKEYADIVQEFSKQGRAIFTGDNVDTKQALIALSCHFIESLDALWTLEHPKKEQPDTTDDDKYYMLPRINHHTQIKPYAKIVERELLYLGRELIKEKTDALTRKNSLKDTKNLFLQGYASHLQEQVKNPATAKDNDYDTPVYPDDSPLIVKAQRTLREIEQVFRNIYYRFVEERPNFSDFDKNDETAKTYDRCYTTIQRRKTSESRQKTADTSRPGSGYSPGYLMSAPDPIPLRVSGDSVSESPGNLKLQEKYSPKFIEKEKKVKEITPQKAPTPLTSSTDSISNSPGILKRAI